MDVAVQVYDNSDMELTFSKDTKPLKICINHYRVYGFNESETPKILYDKWLPVDKCLSTMRFLRNGDIYTFDGGEINTKKHNLIAFAIRAQSGNQGSTNIYKFNGNQNSYVKTSKKIPTES